MLGLLGLLGLLGFPGVAMRRTSTDPFETSRRLQKLGQQGMTGYRINATSNDRRKCPTRPNGATFVTIEGAVH